MENLFESIRAAVAPDATPEARAAGIAACRTILVALEAQPGEPLGATIAAPTVSDVATAVAALRGVPIDQLLDLAIAKLRTALPAGSVVPPAAPIKFQLIPRSQLEVLGKTKP